MVAVVATDGYRVKDVTEWTPVDVHEFLESVLPGHPCADFFTYTSGYVLCSLEKEDLRRQAKSEEAANVIWAELRKCRRAAGARGEFQASTDRGGLEGPPSLTVYVKVRQETAFEVDLLPSDTVAALKEQIAERDGTPPEYQRLIFNGMSMQDDRTLQSYNVHHGASMLLVPQLKEQGKGRPMNHSAPRGILMVPGSKAWQAASPHRPYLPVISSDVSRNFPVSLEFESATDSDAFAQAAQEEPPMLEIPPSGSSLRGTEARVHLDPDTGGVRLDSTGNTLLPGSTYQGLLHFGGRGGQVKVALVTGSAVE